ncbi:Tol-Pal system beta propeller repeat protein TolB [Sphingomonas astaxanthinifaciens]|uniref:Tol-Pal system beta propeller repeat protein TolB n=1 Tax=Sphingomonas astaxanthinifaciens TaxID=407019 RepID=UPI0004A6BDC9|nr:Tol-Pal system beta propeller repeat protein TolB [Sphingomonas astaxanthinifaciens]
MVRVFLMGLTALAASPALAQESDPPPVDVEVTSGGVNQSISIAVPPMPVEGAELALGRNIAGVIASDLRGTGRFAPLGPGGLPNYSLAQADAPAWGDWRGLGSQQLVTGFVRATGPGQVTVGCYLYDVGAGRELVRQGFAVTTDNWRRAAHKCADAIYARLTGEGAFLDTRVVFVAETGPKNQRQKRIAIMDSDGANLRYLTEGEATVVTPRFSPDGRRLAYVSYAGRRARVWVLDIASGQKRLLVPGLALTSAPRFSPDGNRIAYALSANGNTDIWIANADGSGAPQRLTSAPGIDTAPSFSPDGRRIVFESDRSGSQQLYVMDADGSNQRRISFGGPAGSPSWSPRGDKIAFVRIGAFRVGVMNANGGGEQLLTDGWQDESPSWAPNGQFVMFNRFTRDGRSSLYAVNVNGGAARRLPTPQDGSDPSWSPLQR